MFNRSDRHRDKNGKMESLKRKTIEFKSFKLNVSKVTANNFSSNKSLDKSQFDCFSFVFLGNLGMKKQVVIRRFADEV